MLHPHPGTVGRAVQGPRRCPAPVFILHQIRKPRTCHRAAGVDDQLVTAASQPTEVDGNQEQQQTQQAYTSDSQPDLTATFSDLSVDEPAGFPDLGVDPLLVVSSISSSNLAYADGAAVHLCCSDQAVYLPSREDNSRCNEAVSISRACPAACSHPYQLLA